MTGGPPAHLGPRLPRAAGPGQRVLAGPLGQPDDHVDVGGEHLAVDLRRRPEQPPLQPRREPAERAQDPVLDRRAGRRGGRPRRRQATRSGAISHALAGRPVYGPGRGATLAEPQRHSRSGHRLTPAVRGLPPAPRMGRALQTAIWSRRAQWMLEQCRARLRADVHAQHRLRGHLGDRHRPRATSSRSSPATPRSSTPARATRSCGRCSATTRSSSSTRSPTSASASCCCRPSTASACRATARR